MRVFSLCRLLTVTSCKTSTKIIVDDNTVIKKDRVQCFLSNFHVAVSADFIRDFIISY